MLDIQQKRKIRAFAYHRATLVVLGIIVLLALHSTWSVYNKKQESAQLRKISEEQLATLMIRDDELKAKMAKLDTTSGIEEEIRSKFSVAKENENMVVVVPSPPSEVSTTSQKSGFWDIIKNLFNN